MARYTLEYRVVEAHYYEVEADSLDEAKMAWQAPDLEPIKVSLISYKLEHSEELSPIQQAQELLAEIKEDVKELRTELTDKDYYELRGENADWLSGKANIGTEK